MSMPGPIAGTQTPSCISRCGPSSRAAISWSRSTNPARCERSIQPNQTASSPGRVRRFRTRSSPGSSFNVMAAAKSPRSPGRATARRHGPPRRVDIERREDVRFSNGDVQLAGTLIGPTTQGPHPAVILVHASGAEDREYLLPFARFLIRRGVAVLGYDKRGVGGSTGDWNKASFDDLAGDVVAAFEYLKTRSDIQPGRIGVLGWSQAGWVMPLAATRAKDLAFLISISGAGVSGAETTIDQARNEMAANGMRPAMIEQVVELMTLQYDYLRTGQGWDRYAATREKLATRMGGNPPESFPSSPGSSLPAVHSAVDPVRSRAGPSSAPAAGARVLR